MKRGNEAGLLSLPKLSVVAMALAFGTSVPAYAGQTSDQMKQRIEQLENQVKKLQELVEKAVAKADQAASATADAAEQTAEVNRLSVKVDAMDDVAETSGFKDLKISGMIDPTYIYNKAQDTSSFNFLNNFDGRDSSSSYAYDNSFFGQAMLQLDKTFENGTLLKLILAPHKSTSSGYNLGSIVHEASMSVPINGDQNTRFLAGQFADWSGYEFYFGHQNKLITHNLLFDFTLPSFYTGAGAELLRGNWDIKALVANMNQVNQPNSDKNPMLTVRADYEINEFSGFGFAGQFGKLYQSQLNMFEVDGFYTRGDWNWNGQIGAGTWKNSAFNGGDAAWTGISNLVSYNFTPRFTGIARLDYLKNSKNGGGTLGTGLGCVDPAAGMAPDDCTAGTAVAAGDYHNGFGPSAQDAVDYANGLIGSINGANRSALALGMNYALSSNLMLKAEYRFDYADRPMFYYVKDGSYKKDNQVFGVSTVLSF